MALTKHVRCWVLLNLIDGLAGHWLIISLQWGMVKHSSQQIKMGILQSLRSVRELFHWPCAFPGGLIWGFWCSSSSLGAVISARALLCRCVTALLLISGTFLHLALSHLIPPSSPLSLWSRTGNASQKSAFLGRCAQWEEWLLFPHFMGQGMKRRPPSPANILCCGTSVALIFALTLFQRGEIGIYTR